MNYTAILTSLLVIGVVGSAMGAGTMAYFSDTETSKGNTIAAGSLDLSLNGYNGATAAPVVTLQDLKPSIVQYSNPITLKVYNNPGKLWKHIKNVECVTGDVTEPECTEQGGVWKDGKCNWGSAQDSNYITPYTWFDMQKWNSTTQRWDDIIKETPGLGIDDFTSCWIPLGTYGEPGQTNEVTIRQSFHLYKDVTNWAQGDKCTFDEEFMVTQTNAPDPVSDRVWDGKKCVDKP